MLAIIFNGICDLVLTVVYFQGEEHYKKPLGSSGASLIHRFNTQDHIISKRPDAKIDRLQDCFYPLRSCLLISDEWRLHQPTTILKSA